jgi:hypothetical protein
LYIIVETNSVEQCPSWENYWYYSWPRNSPALCGSERFITVITRACHSSQSRVRWVQSPTSRHISLRFILILSHLCLDFQSYIFPSDLPTKTFLYFLVRCPYHNHWFIRSLSI